MSDSAGHGSNALGLGGTHAEQRFIVDVSGIESEHFGSLLMFQDLGIGRESRLLYKRKSPLVHVESVLSKANYLILETGSRGYLVFGAESEYLERLINAEHILLIRNNHKVVLSSR